MDFGHRFSCQPMQHSDLQMSAVRPVILEMVSGKPSLHCILFACPDNYRNILDNQVNFTSINTTSRLSKYTHTFNMGQPYEAQRELYIIKIWNSKKINTLRTGDENLRLYITTVKDG
jgi:hypothetical protein